MNVFLTYSYRRMAYWQRLGELVYKNGVHTAASIQFLDWEGRGVRKIPPPPPKKRLRHHDKSVSSWPSSSWQGLAERRWRPRTQLSMPMPKRRWNLHQLHQRVRVSVRVWVWVWVMMDPPCVHVHGNGRHDTAMSSAVILIVGDTLSHAMHKLDYRWA